MTRRLPAALVAAVAMLTSCGGASPSVDVSTSSTGGITTNAPATTVPTTTASAPRSTTMVSTKATTTTVATCSPAADRGPLTILAASSMENVITELKAEWLASHPCVSALNISYGSSATLAAQITAGAPADVFVSASDATMNMVKNAGLAAVPPRVFARNKATILLYPKSRFVGSVSGLPDLLDSVNAGIKVGLCVASAPCGSLANMVLSNARTTLSRADLTRANVADTETPSVEDLVTKVELGELDAGIAYVSDCVFASPRGLTSCVELPDSINSSNNYLVAGLNTQANTVAFAEWIASFSFGSVLRTKYGFLQP